MDGSKPRVFDEFSERFPGVAKAWTTLGEASRDGPLDAKTVAVVKLALAMGSGLEGPVHSAVRKARGLGCSTEELEQVVALSASTLGMPRAVAAWTWIREVATD